MQIILFEPSAILSGNTHFWQEVSELGECTLSQSTVTEIQLVAEGMGEETSLAAIAKEFLRFLATSGWQITDVTAEHQALVPERGLTMSSKSRLNLALAQCAYGLAELHPTNLIVLVTDDQPQVQRISQLGIPNLCVTTSRALRQWARTKQPPLAIAKVIADLKPTHSTNNRNQESTRTPPVSGRHALSRQFSGQTSHKPIKQSYRLMRAQSAISGLIGLAVTVIVLLLAWRIVQPQQFHQVWQKTGLPPLPSLPFDQDKPNSK